MSDTGTPLDQEPDHIKQLRADAQRAHAADAAVQARDREIAFLQAGINTGTLLGKNVMTAHGDAEITQEAIKATVVKVRAELGLPADDAPPPPPAPDPVTVPGTPEHQLATMQAGLGGAPAPTPPPPTKSGRERAMDEYYDAQKRGAPITEAREIGLSALILSAQQGDTTTVWNDLAFQSERAKHGHGGEYDNIDRTDALPKVAMGPNKVQIAKQERAEAARAS